VVIKAISNTPHVVASTESLGDVSIRRLNMRDMIALQARNSTEPFDASKLASSVLQRVASASDGSPMTAEELAKLKPEERGQIVEAVVADHPSLFDLAATSADPEATKPDDAPRLTLSRAEGESAEDYLFRGWSNHNATFLAGIRKTLATAESLGKGLSGPMRMALAANNSASAKLSEQLKAMHLGGAAGALSHIEAVRQPTPTFDLRLPPNPIVETNAILSDVAQHIGDMRDLASTTAEMQQSLNTVAQTILTEFKEGADAAAKSSKDALSVAKIGLIVSIVTAVLTLLAIGVAVVLAILQSQDQATQQARSEALGRAELVSQQQHTKALTRYAEALERAAAKAAPAAKGKHGRGR
jgi:uncharacterized membrane protein